MKKKKTKINWKAVLSLITFFTSILLLCKIIFSPIYLPGFSCLLFFGAFIMFTISFDYLYDRYKKIK